MIPSWPASLWQSPARQRWTGGPREERAVFAPEIGPPITRRRTTGETRVFEASFPNFTGAMRTAFEAWFRDELEGGVKRFAWRDPVGGDIALWQIVAGGELAYSFTALGANRHELSLNLMRMPGTPWWAAYVPADTARVPYVVADHENGVFGVAGLRTAASAVDDVTGTFDVRTLDLADVETEVLDRVLSGADRTNLALRSGDLSVSPWTWGGTSGSIGAGDDAPVAGAETFWTLTAADTTTDRRQGITVAANQTHVASCYAKAGTVATARLGFHITGGSGTAAANVSYDLSAGTSAVTTQSNCTIAARGMEQVLPGIWRIWFRMTYATGGTGGVLMLHDGSSAGQTLQYWGAQVEQAAGAPSYYIPTAAAAVTRPDSFPADEQPGIKRILGFTPE